MQIPLLLVCQGQYSLQFMRCARFSFRCVQSDQLIERISLVIANKAVSVKSSGPLLTVFQFLAIADNHEAQT